MWGRGENGSVSHSPHAAGNPFRRSGRRGQHRDLTVSTTVQIGTLLRTASEPFSTLALIRSQDQLFSSVVYYLLRIVQARTLPPKALRACANKNRICLAIPGGFVRKNFVCWLLSWRFVFQVG